MILQDVVYVLQETKTALFFVASTDINHGHRKTSHVLEATRWRDSVQARRYMQGKRNASDWKVVKLQLFLEPVDSQA